MNKQIDDVLDRNINEKSNSPWASGVVLAKNKDKDGLYNAPATFERLMETVLSGLQWQICLIHLDDIIGVGNTFKNMLNKLTQVFDRLLSSNLKLRAKKCHLFSKTVEFLGHLVSEEGVSTDPSKILAVKNWSAPVNLTEVRSFVGLCIYYRRFISYVAAKAKPLNRLPENGTKFLWTKACQESFESLKQSLISAPVLAHPDFFKTVHTGYGRK